MVKKDDSALDCEFFIPRTFFRAIEGNQLSKENPLVRFYLQNASMVNIVYLRSLLQKYKKNIKIHDFSEEYLSKHEKLKTALPEYLKLYVTSQDNNIVNCLLEEWMFLQENS